MSYLPFGPYTLTCLAWMPLSGAYIPYMHSKQTELEKVHVQAYCIYVPQDRQQLWLLVNMTKNFEILYKMGNFLASSMTVNFSRSTSLLRISNNHILFRPLLFTHSYTCKFLEGSCICLAVKL
jgi:hypothetical protein